MSLDEAISLYDKGQFAESLNIFETLHSRSVKNEEKDLYLFNKASCIASLGKHDEAIDCMDQIDTNRLNIYDKNSLIYNRALCIYKNLQSQFKSSNDNTSLLHLQSGVLDELTILMGRLDSESLQYQSTRDLIKTLIDEILANLWQSEKFKTLENFLMHIKATLEVETDADYHPIWRKNLAHTLFMKDTCYDECYKLYESLLPDTDNQSILSVDSDVLSGLCISYVLTGRNSEAEQLIKEVEQEENDFANFDDMEGDLRRNELAEKAFEDHSSHLDHINLAVGCLYCVKSNFEFGLGRIFKTMEPLKEKLGPTNWSVAKACILALMNQYCKQTLDLDDNLSDKIVKFLIQCEILGIHIPVEVGETNVHNLPTSVNSVTYEARYLRSLMISIIHD